MSVRLIRLRYAGTCVGCGGALPVGTRAWWDEEARSTTCSGCRPLPDAEPGGALSLETRPENTLDEPSGSLATGQAGWSARREYEKRHERREQQIEKRWGPLAGVVKFLSDDPQSIKASAKGSKGERQLADRLLREVGDRAVLLHDRKVPRTRGNIDHIAIAASGVWVIDAKH